jgi:hypothetical protein
MQPHYDLTAETLQQNAARMSAPLHNEINQVVEMLGISQAQAKTLLQNNNNDVARSIDAYFNDPNGSLTEANLAAHNTWEAQDNIPFEGDDDARSTGAMPALSRPPSRVGQSGGGGNVHPIDLTQTHAQATTQADTGTTQEQDEEAQLQEAMRLSLAEAQESGVTSTDPTANAKGDQYFGPATRNDYDTSQWQMVAVASSREIMNHPPPSKRRRINGQPAFLRPSNDKSYLAALLTIYHAIPMAREALLFPSMQIASYGYDPSWWSGASDANSRSISVQTDENHDIDRTKALAEVQCLMAFLDNTQRAYGSVEALQDLPLIRKHRRTASTPFSVFLEAWQDAAHSQQPDEPLAGIFHSEAKKAADPDNEQVKGMVYIEPQIYPRPNQTLINLLDTTVWDDTDGAPLEDVYITHVGDVFTIRIWGDANLCTEGLQLTAPATWYPDRYMAALRDQTRQMRAEVQKIRAQMYEITNHQRRLESFIGSNRRPVRIKEVLEAAAKAAPTILNDRYSEHQPNEELNAANVSAIEGQIRAVLARIDEKVTGLESKKNALQKEIDVLELQYTGPGDDPSQPPNLKYTLTGVATKPEVMYVRQRSHDLLGLETDDTMRKRDEWQWWHIDWPPSSGQKAPIVGPVSQAQAHIPATDEHNQGSALPDLPYTISEVSEADVIEAVRTEYHTAVLVYASEKALDFQGSALPTALKQMIEQDNVSFGKEIREETEPETQASHGTANIMDDVPDLVDNTTSSDTPTGRTPDGFGAAERKFSAMSIGAASSYRDEHGQPSPKRPKSSHEAGEVYEDNAGSPPPYDDSVLPAEESQGQQKYKYQNKIGEYADSLSKMYGDTAEELSRMRGHAADGGTGLGARPGSQMDGIEQSKGESVHIERSDSLPR